MREIGQESEAPVPRLIQTVLVPAAKAKAKAKAKSAGQAKGRGAKGKAKAKAKAKRQTVKVVTLKAGKPAW